MCQPIIVILAGLTAVYATPVLQPPISLSVTEPSLAANNVTFRSGFPDPRFRVSPSIGADFIPVNPTLLSILFFMAGMSYRDHNESVAANAWTAPGAPEVVIATEDVIQAKYLLWGAFAGVEYMIKYQRFQELLLTLRFEREIVGRIWILPPNSVLNLRLNTSTPSLTQRSNHPWAQHNSREVEAMLPDLGAVNNTIPLATDFSVRMVSLPSGAALTRFDVFLVCYAALVHMSLAKPESLMENFVSRGRLNIVFIYMLKRGPGVKIYRAIQVMLHLPRAMLSSPEGFREVAFTLRLDRIKVLEGSIDKGRVLPTLL